MRNWTKRLPVAMLVIALIAAIAACGRGEGGEGESGAADTIRFAVTDMEGLEELQRDFGAFRDALEAALGMTVKFYPVADRTAAVAALQARQVDFLLTGPAEYVILKSRSSVQPVVGLARPGYRSAIVVLKDSPIQAVADLKGKKLSMADVGSTSGHLAPAKLLLDAGIDPQKDVQVVMLGDSDLQALYNKDVDAWGGGWSYLEKFMAGKGLTLDDFRILIEGPQLPSDIFVASEQLDHELVTLLRNSMIEHEDELIEAMLQSDANQKYAGTKLMPAEDGQYEEIRDMYRAIGITDFDHFVEE